jgi:hypothetical protein
MTNTKLTKNENKTFNVVDTRTNKVVARNLKGSKAAAYREYYEQQINEAELFWEGK